MKSIELFNFSKNSDVSSWTIVNDGVMGGLSESSFLLNDEGHGVFKGNVSLENNGGFSSVRHSFEKLNIGDSNTALLKVKGDGKNFQFRVKAKSTDYYSYIYTFPTSGEWEEISIPLNEMYASFRGRTLDLPNFSEDHLEQITFLIGNKKKESFELLIDKIELK